ncbi:MAG: hypothetical protein JGK03_09455 [Microcoleus sp. PH2017_25_DOB_D_A]|uniref:hypothetical protein n=1 Tax=unclassified Microcoleus TaxID=2642155 RepID=UPI001D705FB3|nr:MULTISPECIES: hypothetical protein [unclassified Microcoleus]TAE43835.1 MAG: hypothetical protein EAZ90_09395 [Oscillatoriales cyanobacterium]MCC3515212.1 hypothetical protein [Microcoleus sp. PH2017_18_LLB_O_A]MCC3534412.1 hypothetical protein [Microcoleus sp. PH2017_25_DOB_D_A]MCC3546642.1 hypothetical protein [Microcoleus sp. PH2017_24_DOB_U_A]MCC3586700.1 hypothetical protein [Microcoleus sp. PH2017_30_WIL_O_A]
MDTDTWELQFPVDADVIALDKDDRIVVLIEVEIIQAQEADAKQKIVNRAIDWLKAVLAKLSERNAIVPYAMFVDAEQILIFKWDGVNLSEPVCTLNTGEICRYYMPSFGSKWIFERTIEGLIESWLHDLDYNWKSESPPASEQIAAIGLLPLLAGGTTKSGVELGGNYIYRDQLSDEYCYRT